MYTNFPKWDRLNQNATISLSSDPQQNVKIQTITEGDVSIFRGGGALGVKSDSKHLLSLVLIGQN